MAYKVPFVDLPAMFKLMKGELSEVLEEVIFNRADFIMRSDLREFEHNFAEFMGMKHAIGVNSGTDALYLSLRAAGVSSGDEVITVAHTFVATLASIVHCGATPILIDVGQDFNMNVSQLESAITNQTKAIIPVHLNGRLCKMDKVMEIANQRNLIVIEDTCQSLGAKFDGQKGGTFGLTGCWSLYPMKIFGGAGDGGILVTNDDAVANQIRCLRDHGQDRKTGEIIGYGINSRLDNLQAAILDLKLQYFSGWIDRRREIAETYRLGLKDLPIQLPHYNDERYYDVYQNYVIRSSQRDGLLDHLNTNGIEVLVSWPKPVYSNKSLALDHYKLPETEQICQEVISLPMNTELADEQIEYVIDTIQNFQFDLKT